MKRMRGWIAAAAALVLSVPGGAGAAAQKAEAKKEPAKPAAVDLSALFKIHYETRVRSFREQNLAYRNVVLVGDSITEGFEVPRYFPGRRVLNRGIGGDVIGHRGDPKDGRGVLRRLDESVFDCAPADVFLMIGINDLNSGRNLDLMEEGYRDLLGQIKRRLPAVRVYVQSLLPTGKGFAKQNVSVLEFNRRLKAVAATHGYEYVDLHRAFADSRGELKAEYTDDGLHLKEAGYRVWQREVERLMKWDTR